MPRKRSRISYKMKKVVKLKPGTYTFKIGSVIPYKGNIIVVVKPRNEK